jgi:hypothetical protein
MNADFMDFLKPPKNLRISPKICSPFEKENEWKDPG